MRLSYAGFGGMFGGAWEYRLHLVELPACALTHPGLAACRRPRPVPSLNEAGGRFVQGTVMLRKPVPGGRGGTVLAAISGPSGPTGAFTASPLRPSGTWTEQQGAFTYSYPIAVPPALSGQAPSVALSYDSQSIDAETPESNTQDGMIGDGWDYSPGFIERSYQPCSQDGITNSGDLCWGGQNATLSLGSQSGPLVLGSNGIWHLADDDGTTVQLLTGASNGLWSGEYWLVTTTDGTKYYFGLDHNPDGSGTDTSTNAAWGEPVFNPTSSPVADPCYSAAKGQASECQMGWRWNLDFVVDPDQRLTQYVYTTETNYYKMGGGQGTGTLTQYVRAGELTQIKYGFLVGDAAGGTNPAVLVNFTYSDRCLSDAATCESHETAAMWPDVPWDQLCGSTGACSNNSPTFWSEQRLTKITTKVRESGTYQLVDSYALTQGFPAAAGQTVMSLTSITRTGEDDATATGPSVMPSVAFTTTELDNRVDQVAGVTTAATQVFRPRISSIATETGESIAVNYAAPGCSRVNGVMPANAYTNTLPCFPVNWTPPGVGMAEVHDWFLKYLVSEVTQTDQTGSGSPALEWRYSYMGGAAWHFDDNPMVKASDRTWDQFRGFAQVKTLTGAPGDPVGEDIVTYLQGMDGDNNGVGGTRTVTVQGVTDSNWLAGQVIEDDTHTQSGGPIVKKVVNGPWSFTQTASQAQPGGLPALTSHRMTQSQSDTEELFTGSAWDTDPVTSYYNGDGLVAAVDSDPEGSAETCTSTSYATPPTANPMMKNYPDQVTVVTGGATAAGACPAASKTNLQSDSQTYYDHAASTLSSLGTLGTLAYPGGLVTGTRQAVSWTTGENWQAKSATGYDGLGRATSVNMPTPVGASGPTAVTTAYTPAYVAGSAGTELPTLVVTTNPLGWQTTTAYDQGREQPLTVTDPNGEQTTETFSPLGGLTSATMPADQASGDQTEKFSYRDTGSDPLAVTTQVLREDGSYSSDVKLYDGMGQLRQEQSTPANGAVGRVITDTFYNSDGEAIKTRNPYYDALNAPSNLSIFAPNGDGSIPGWTATSYDGLGRVIASTFNSGTTQQWQTTTAYPGMNETDVTPPPGGTATSAFTNVLGQTTASWQYTGISAPDGVPADADVTSYTYTPAGQTATVTDNASDTWTYGYDLLGEKVSETDPGTTATATTTYDGAGNVATTTDADGHLLSYGYDHLGRKISEYSGVLNTGTELDAWAYDTASLNNTTAPTLGQLASATSFDAAGGLSGPYTETVTGYDTAYQPAGTETDIPAGDLVPGATGPAKFTTTNTYVPLTGQLDTVEYSADDGLPDETVNYSYDLQGELIASGGASPYLDQIVYDSFGQITRATYGVMGLQLVQTYNQDDGTHRLVSSSTSLQTFAGAADNDTYAYNQAGDLTAVSDQQNVGGTQTQCFAYNDQQELTTAWTDTQGITTAPDPSVQGLGGCTTASPSSTTIGGPTPYWQSYAYSTLGDRTSAVFHDPAGHTANNITQTLTYPTTGTQPDAPSTITSQYGTAGSKDTTSVLYDAAGNTASQATASTGASPPPPPPSESAITYNAQGLIATVTTPGSGTSGYTYDASGNLLLQTDPLTTTSPAATTLYVDGGAEQITFTSSGTTASRIYAGPDGTTITRTATSGSDTLTYQPGTSQSTATESIAIDTVHNTQTLTRRYYDPYGNPIGTQVTWPDNLGFVGQPADPVTSLDLLGARQYDSATGRFLSLDPVDHRGDPLAMGGYSYADNNPVTNADPTGQSCAPGASSNGNCNDQPVQENGNGGGDGNGYTGTGYTGTGYTGTGYGGTGYGDSGSNPISTGLGSTGVNPFARFAKIGRLNLGNLSHLACYYNCPGPLLSPYGQDTWAGWTVDINRAAVVMSGATFIPVVGEAVAPFAAVTDMLAGGTNIINSFRDAKQGNWGQAAWNFGSGVVSFRGASIGLKAIKPVANLEEANQAVDDLEEAIMARRAMKAAALRAMSSMKPGPASFTRISPFPTLRDSSTIRSRRRMRLTSRIIKSGISRCSAPPTLWCRARSTDASP